MLKIGQKKFLLFVKFKTQFRELIVINDLNGEPITATFYEKELQETSREKFRTEKVIKRKVVKFYVKWKRYDNLFNSWIKKNTLNAIPLYKNESILS